LESYVLSDQLRNLPVQVITGNWQKFISGLNQIAQKCSRLGDGFTILFFATH
jgi:hypothetical protein